MNAVLSHTPAMSNSVQPRSRGLDLDVKEFGCLEDSSAIAGDPELCRRKMAEDGYLFLRGFFPRTDVLEARNTSRAITRRSMP
jgi:hypothetical protein